LTALIVFAGQTRRARTAGNARREQYSVAGANVSNSFTYPLDFAGDVASANMRQWDIHAAHSLANPKIEVIQGARAYAYKNFPSATDRFGYVGISQNVWPAMLRKDSRLHPFLPFILGLEINDSNLASQLLPVYQGHWMGKMVRFRLG
jgi:hypothetical protein